MKATKWIVGAGAVIGIASTFLDWMSVELTGGGASTSVPTGGMDHGGVVFITLLCLPLIAAAVGALKRFGRGMATLALVGGLLATLMSMAKYADISEAAALLAEHGLGTASVAGGYWLLFVGAAIPAVGAIVGLLKPEPKLDAAPTAAPAYGVR